MASTRTSAKAGHTRTPKPSGASKAPRRRTAHKPAAKTTKQRSGSQADAKPKPRPKPTAPKAKSARPKSARPKTSKAASTKPKRRPTSSAPQRPFAARALTTALAVGVLAVGLAVAYFLWFRDSGFVAVEQVTVEGIEGPEATQVTEALTKTAREMTTLNLDEARLANAVSEFPTVVAIQAEPDFPHGLAIEVTGRPPVLTVSDGGTAVPVSGDGTLLRGVAVSEEGLPALQVESLPVEGGLEGEPLALARAAGAAPEPLRPLIKELAVDPGEGIEVVLKGGLPVKLGDPDALEEKWAAVAAVLANPQVKTLTHLDVRVPERPSIGGAAPAPKGTGRPITP